MLNLLDFMRAGSRLGQLDAAEAELEASGINEIGARRWGGAAGSSAGYRAHVSR